MLFCTDTTHFMVDKRKVQRGGLKGKTNFLQWLKNSEEKEFMSGTETTLKLALSGSFSTTKDGKKR